MYKLLWLVPVLLLAGCSNSNPSTAKASNAPPSATEPVDRTAPLPAAAEPSAVPPAPPPVAETPEPPVIRETTVPAGASLRVRLDQSVSTKYDRAGSRFSATLSAPVVIDSRVVIPTGTRFEGRVTQSKPSGRLKGRAVLALRLDSFVLRGQRYAIRTSSVARVSNNHKKRNIGIIGGGAGIAAAIGAIAGGGKGALIGGAVGAGAGAAGAAATGRKQEEMRAETPMTFVLRMPVQL